MTDKHIYKGLYNMMWLMIYWAASVIAVGLFCNAMAVLLLGYTLEEARPGVAFLVIFYGIMSFVIILAVFLAEIMEKYDD